MGEDLDLRSGLTKLRAMTLVGIVGLVSSHSFAQAAPVSRELVCSADQAAIDQLSATLSHMALWDDSIIAKAQSSVAKLQQARQNVMRLARRLNSLESSASNAAAFDKSGEANFWKRDAAEVRADLAAENKRAKALAALAGVSCPGCTYSVLITKVEAAINAALSARAQASQAQQQIAVYRSNMAAARCRG